MGKRIDLDEVISRAIILEIGQRLRASFREDELPAALTVQLDRLGQLDDQLRSPPTVAGLESEKIGKPTAAPRSVSPVVSRLSTPSRFELVLATGLLAVLTLILGLSAVLVPTAFYTRGSAQNAPAAVSESLRGIIGRN
jgi:hypothetical protein